MYETGHGVPQNLAEAIKWWRLAAERGYAVAQGLLSAQYGLGEGVPQDDVKAHMWANLAASRSSSDEDYDRATRVRNLVAKRMTPAQIAEAQKLAREWRPLFEKAE